ncbi:MAG: PQQ-dependent sugar dehydrogenase [Hyphomonadaceae bacterium]|nr:PQQ-dependent sugar dehydrogenase [Hyphomonadaceae bacterium]
MTDNGPRGGDEINIIGVVATHGWPLITYGRVYMYDTDGGRQQPWRATA